MSQLNKSKKIPLIVVAVYLILVLLATIPVFTGDDPLDAVFLVLLVLPWSFLITPIVDSINPMLFDNIEWSTEKVFESTEKIIAENGLNLEILGKLNDVDTRKELESWLRNSSDSELALKIKSIAKEENIKL